MIGGKPEFETPALGAETSLPWHAESKKITTDIQNLFNKEDLFSNISTPINQITYNYKGSKGVRPPRYLFSNLSLLGLDKQIYLLYYIGIRYIVSRYSAVRNSY